ncbi:hypothetical protein [Haladaptatus pallidirubidus]|uniref:hypothetical protein n=1 Tax=Haladaptatus pallidirubidus TaxID=1008152 RepID=UPI0036F40ACD
MDCVARTEGLYPVCLYERELIEPRVELDFARLFDAPLADRLTAYLDVPFRAIEPAISSWNFSADVVPSVKSDEVLPLLANDLALVRIAESPVSTAKTEAANPERLEAFYRTSSPELPESNVPDLPVNPVFEIEKKIHAETRERAWVGPGYPFGVNKLTPETVSARFARERQTKQDATIEVDIICNDPSMEDESAVRNYYHLRELPEFEVSTHHQLTVAKLADRLTTSSDFLHYIGHISEDGIRCADGYLDVRTLSEVNITTFLLNACSSYEQGAALIERGARSGVATLSRVGNELATNIGQSFVRLLSTGFSVRNALTVIHRHSLRGIDTSHSVMVRYHFARA